MRLLEAVANRLSSQPARAAVSEPPAQSASRRRTARSVNPGLPSTIAHGRYHVEGPIGTGASGIIYSAWQPQLQRRVALKVLRPQYEREPHMVERLRHEAKMASTVRNEHVVEVLDSGELETGQAYLVLEHIEGPRLSDVLDQHGALDVTAAVDIAVQIARALRGTHFAGIYHGDVKPDNILLSERPNNPHFVKLIDFGVADEIDTSHRAQRFGTVCGTPSYMSPEQASGETLDGRTDIYSLGVVLYEMLSGATPIRGSHPRELLQRQRTLPPLPLRSNPRCTNVPPRLEAIVHRCLEKDPARRYQSASDLLRELEFIQSRLHSHDASDLEVRSAPQVVVRPSVAGLPRLTSLATAVPANDLGGPLTSLPFPLLTPKPPTVADRARARPHAAESSRQTAPLWASATHRARRPTRRTARRHVKWGKRLASIVVLGLTLGYASASVYTMLSGATASTR